MIAEMGKEVVDVDAVVEETMGVAEDEADEVAELRTLPHDLQCSNVACVRNSTLTTTHIVHTVGNSVGICTLRRDIAPSLPPVAVFVRIALAKSPPDQ